MPLKHPRTFLAVALILATIVIVRVASTYRVFSQTAEEPIHIAAGLEWLTTRGYQLDIEHPPLARIAFALHAFMNGTTVSPQIERLHQGNQILYANERYLQNLAWSRAGNLPFLLLALAIVTIWTRRLFGNAAAIVALALFGALPGVLAHAGLATTDLAALATTAAITFALARYLDAPSWRNALAFGVFAALGLLSKFSVPFYVAIAAAVLIAARVIVRPAEQRLRPRTVAIHAFAATLIVIAGLWAGYKFESGTLIEMRLAPTPLRTPESEAARYTRVPGYEWVRPDIMERWWEYGRSAKKRAATGIDFVDWAKASGYPSPLAGRNGDTMAGAPAPKPLTASDGALEPFRARAQWLLVRVPIPAPTFFAGAGFVRIHNRLGHPTFLLGTQGWLGWWYYFPVVFFFKTPLAFIALSVAGISLLAFHGWRHRDPESLGIALMPVAIMAAVLPSNINIGLRHILPVYPFLAITAAFAVVRMWRNETHRALARTAVVVLLGWFFAATTVAHPDYLAYFNEMAGPHPEQIVVDSNLDWGQDLLRLAGVVKDENIANLHVAYSGSADVGRHLQNAEALDPTECTTGWIAISEMEFHSRLPNGDLRFQWLKRYKPVRRVGRSIWLYYIPPGACSGAT